MSFVSRIANQLDEIKAAGLFKTERIFSSPRVLKSSLTGVKC
jgi:hypothetical protein